MRKNDPSLTDEPRLQELRARIDALDGKIQALVTERARLAEDVAKTKRAAGSNNFYRPEREAEVLRQVQARNQGPLSDEAVARIFREIMSECLALQKVLKIAFLGPEGTFTQEAALKHFGHAVTAVPLATVDEVFREVESGNVNFGVVPIENSTEGIVSHTLDRFMTSPLRVCGEIELRVHHYLLSKAAGLGEIRRVISHQQSLAQCRGWLDAHLSGVERTTAPSNAEAARQAAQASDLAAIAGASAGEIYGLRTLAANIEDEPSNTTRFLVIGDQETGPSGNDKTSLMVSGKNRPGLLHALLTPLARLGINMTRIESRPSRRGVWEYVFFFDIDGHAQDEKVRQALADLAREAASVKLLGSYPRAVP